MTRLNVINQNNISISFKVAVSAELYSFVFGNMKWSYFKCVVVIKRQCDRRVWRGPVQ